MVSATFDLSRLRAPGLGLFSSGGVLFSDAVFGRDSVAAAETLLHLHPAIAQDVITTLARFQGVVDAPTGLHTNEEEPGKIHHEHRSLFVGARRVSASSEEVLRHLASQWGGDPSSLTYYGAADPTPLYARLVANFCAVHGEAILAAAVTRPDGSTVTIRESLLEAMDWITRRIDSSDVGMIEFQRRNPDGIPFQVWKDSGTSYIHRDGTLAKSDAPIAAIEVQGYTYDALVGAAKLLGRSDWQERASALRRRVLDLLWMPAERYFAMGVDRGADGRPRWIDSIASNGALILDTGLLDGAEGAAEIVAGVAERICSPDFMTEVGIRCRSVQEQALIDFQDYHGTWAVWPKETFEVMRGLHRQGLHRAARQLGNRLLNAINVAGANVEFLYVSPDGRVMYDFHGRDSRSITPEEVAGTNQPEAPQAWTVTAVLRVKHWYGLDRRTDGTRAQLAGESWRQALDADIVSRMDHVDAFRSRDQLEAAYARRGDFVLNLPLGRERDRLARVRGSLKVSVDVPEVADLERS